MSLIELDDVVIGYRREAPLSPPVRLKVDEGDVIGVLGPNGAGKSTLLRAMLGMVPPLSGAVRHPGARAPRIGYVPQGHRLEFG